MTFWICTLTMGFALRFLGNPDERAHRGIVPQGGP